MRARLLLPCLLAAAVSFLLPEAGARWVLPVPIPVERLEENFRARVEEQPEDAQARYHLGRVHSLAFTLGRDRIPAYGGEEDPRLIDHAMERNAQTTHEYPAGGVELPGPLEEREVLGHLAEAVRQLGKAVQMKASEPRYQLGLAYVLDEGAALAVKLDKRAWMTPPVGAPMPQAAGVWLRDLASADPAVRREAAERIFEMRRILRQTLHDLAGDAEGAVRTEIRTLLQTIWKAEAAERYYQAFALSFPQDRKHDAKPIDGPFGLGGMMKLISWEAGHAYLRLREDLEGWPVGSDPAWSDAALAQVREGLEELEALPDNRMITPIVLGFEEDARLADLEDRERVVSFDLDGDGVPGLWDWVRPEAGLLVWDPEQRGRVDSGLHLFGNATFWMFFEDGYQALDALDDDRDGWLRGAELRGLAVWFDHDQNGRSQPDEVRTAGELGVRGIACAPTAREGEALHHPEGLVLRDGRRLPTWDWIAQEQAAPRP